MADTLSGDKQTGTTARPLRPALRARMAPHVLPCASFAFRSTLRVAGLALAGLVIAVLSALVAFRFVDPPGSMLIASRQMAGQTIDQRWEPVSRISPNLVRAVIMSEDNQFCHHHGVDVHELTAAIDRVEHARQQTLGRGASTISMQVVKNLVLWSDRSYVRKVLEIPLTVLMEFFWPKRRIMEVYLNIAEWGPGIFGAEAAARHHFHKSAAALTVHEATLLAVALPNPFIRVPSHPSPQLLRVAGVVERRVKVMGDRAACVLGP